jgi:hypothetical protein
MAHTVKVTWHPDAVREAVQRVSAITTAQHSPEAYRTPTGALLWIDLACLVDVARAVLADRGEDGDSS